MGFFGNGNGYRGYSMSNNAVDAYDRGEMPMSHWSKSEIQNEIEDLYGKEVASLTKRLKVSDLRSLFLEDRGRHHTGKLYNYTNFYGVKDDLELERIRGYIDRCNNFYERQKVERKTNAKPKSKEKTKYALIKYKEWVGTRKHPKAIEHVGVAKYRVKDGKTSLADVYLSSEMKYPETKKRISSCGILKEFDKKPHAKMKFWKRVG